jgi:hypothetical protein
LEKIKESFKDAGDENITKAFAQFDNMISEVNAMSGNANIDLGMFSKSSSTMSVGDYQKIANLDSKFR